MTDTMTKEQRSRLMSKVRSKETGMEIDFRKLLRDNGLANYRKYADLPGKPDIVFEKERLVIFLDSDFFHGWEYPKLLPKTNNEFWRKKIWGNMGRDARVGKELRLASWNVLRFWGHEIKRNPEACIAKIKRVLDGIEKRRSTDIVAIDWFCGAGGMTKGLSDAGIGVLKGIDIDRLARKTYEDNNPGSIFVETDITKMDKETVMAGVTLKKGQKLLFAACAPCQPFSLLYKTGKTNDLRKSLLLNFSEMVDKFRPDYILMENVPGLGGEAGKDIYDAFLKTLSKLGYYYDQKTVNAKNYGVPQNRKRLVLLASKRGPIEIPDVTHGEGKLPFVTVRQTIEKYPLLRAGDSNARYPNHHARKLEEINLRRLRNTAKDGGSRRDWPKKLVLRCHKKKECGYNDVYGRMKWDSPSPTMTCRCTCLANGRFGHPTQNRAISLREAASLQSFPDDYIFYGSATSITRHIGNAVPAKLAAIFARTFVEHSKIYV